MKGENGQQLNHYSQIMEQVAHPEGVKSRHPVVCTQAQAERSIGELYRENPSWRIVDMKYIKVFGE